MFYTIREVFFDKDYYLWIIKRIALLEESIRENKPCDHCDDMELLKRKLFDYTKEKDRLEEIYGIQS